MTRRAQRRSATLSSADMRAAQRAGLYRAASLGIAAVHEMAGPAISSADDLAGLLALAAEEPLPQVFGYWGELFAIATAQELGALGAAGDLFCDGSLGSHTAAVHEPYSDRPDSTRVAALGHRRRRRTHRAVHRGGPAGRVPRDRRRRRRPGPRRDGRRHRADGRGQGGRSPDRACRDGGRPGQAGRIGAGRVHATGVRRGVGRRGRGCTRSDWGPSVRAGSTGSRTSRRPAYRVAFGSDTPVTVLDPWGGVRAAASPARPVRGDQPSTPPSTRIPGPAGRSSADHADGVLAPGAPATFAVWRTAEGSRRRTARAARPRAGRRTAAVPVDGPSRGRPSSTAAVNDQAP